MRELADMSQNQPVGSLASFLVGSWTCGVPWHKDQRQTGQVRGKPRAREPSPVPNRCWVPAMRAPASVHST